MAIIKNPITVVSGGGGDVVNGIIESYKASTSTIAANTFVEFVNGTLSTGTSKQLSSVDNTYQEASAILVDTNKVFITHQNGDYLYGIVCTISGTTITAGTDTQLSTTSGAYRNNSITSLGSGKVFIAHYNDGYLYGMVCTISGTTITKGTDTQLSASLNTATVTSCAALGSTKVFVAHSGSGSSNSLYGIVCTISGTTITVGTDTQIHSSLNANASAVALGTNKVAVSWSAGYVTVCTISGTTITVGTSTRVKSTTGNYLLGIVAINSGTVLVYYPITSGSSSYLGGIACTISGTTITAGTETRFSTLAGTSDYVSAVALGGNRVFIAHKGNSTASFLYTICVVRGVGVAVVSSGTLASNQYAYQYTPALAVLESGKVFCAYRGGGTSATKEYFYGVVHSVPITVKASTSAVDGLTKASLTTSKAGEVYVLD